MRILKNILARVLAFWALNTFIIMFLVVFIPSMFCWLIPDPKGEALFIRIARLWMNVWLPLVGCRVKLKGEQNFRKGEIYIVVFNHNSMMDIPISCPYVPGPNKTIAKSSFAKIPLFGFYYRKGAVLVDRSSEESRRRSYDKMKAVLKKGMHMSIYPEGTRNRTGEPLKKFHDGAFRLSVETGNAILPAVIFNTKKVLPIDKNFWVWPGNIEMHFLPPVAPGTLYTEQLKEKVFNLMKEYYLENS